MDVRVTVVQDEVSEHARVLSQKLKSPGVPLMLKVGREMLADVDTRFDTAGYGTWQPLSTLTVSRKGGRDEILIDTGNMRRAVGISEVTDDRVVVTVPHGGKSNDPAVPVAHQEGSEARNLPQRQILEVTRFLTDRVDAVVSAWLDE